MSETSDEPDDDVMEWLTNMLYTGVGLGILAINRIQVARRSAHEQLRSDAAASGNPGLEALSELLADPDRLSVVLQRFREELADIDDRLDGVEHRFAGILERVEPDLPQAARELSMALRKLAEDHAGSVRQLLGLERG